MNYLFVDELDNILKLSRLNIICKDEMFYQSCDKDLIEQKIIKTQPFLIA